MVNLSCEQGVFPDERKIAVITLLYKAKDPMFFNNYRPISPLSVFSKIFERLMYNRILNFINRHMVILIENLVNALDNEKCAVGIYFYFQKVFDNVDHSIYLINCIVMVYVALRINGSSATCPIANNQ